jgi:membrane-bound ClpP family serine protease
MDPIYWAMLLLAVGLLLVLLEFLIPSSGILGRVGGALDFERHHHGVQ